MQRNHSEHARSGARYPDVHETDPDFDGRALRVGIVMARFNLDICEALLDSCVQELLALGVSPGNISIVTVPGALEIPLVLQTMARSGRHDALVALGAIIRGETYHFELVSNEMGAGITRVGLDCALPIANGVLTTEDHPQAQARVQEKGADCARAAVEMARLLKVVQ
ncbi:MAG: 6,7-dimethyl-8-ribityllumazine synthase [Thauera sp.]|jgi:6,7-dimethyl-8-ribityllumazine synthase|nr:6,7-dimethyl-8-ribityllumazine synthase [Thauera sp.]